MKFLGLLSAVSAALVITADAAVHGAHGHNDIARRMSGHVARGSGSKWSWYDTETGNA
jgi:hypothetical protein